MYNVWTTRIGEEKNFKIKFQVILVFYRTTWPIELKFYVKTPYDKLAKIYSKYFSHMTKMAATPIYGKNPLKIFSSRTRWQMILGLGM